MSDVYSLGRGIGVFYSENAMQVGEGEDGESGLTSSYP